MSSLRKWLDGEDAYPLRAEWTAPPSKKTRTRSTRADDRGQLEGFLRVYAVCAVVLCGILILCLVLGALRLPAFASPGNPTDNEVVRRYVGSAEAETGAENVVAGMILNYRGFDTFGESCVLFVALCCVELLLWATKPALRDEAAASRKEAPRDAILARVCTLAVPCVLVYGLCILFNGHLSPGGGFSGGAVLGAALILFAVAYGRKSVRRFFTQRVFDAVRISGLLLYALLFGAYVYLGANGIESGLSRVLVQIIDVAVGLVVMSTMYGFFAFYTKGEL
jgi:multicomponent Na+:H+ antiporter subunit B